MNEKAVELLKLDMMGEHQAIIQYLRHAYDMGEITLAFEVEAIAREEMRHLDSLADLITELGGDPTMERAPVDLAVAPVAEQMLKDVGLEQQAIDQYRAHIEAIDLPSVRLALSRILHDELNHKGMFEKYTAEAAQANLGVPAVDGTAQAVAAETPGPARMAAILNEGVRHEYTVTLQYLYHAFVAKDKELSEELQNIAINEMQHMGWLSEAAEAQGALPDMTPTDLVLTRVPAEMLQADIAVEREVTRAYTGQITELGDEQLQALVKRIRDHEIYHDARFGELLAKVKAEEAPPAPPEPPASCECKPEESSEPPSPPPAIPTVGSLRGDK